MENKSKNRIPVQIAGNTLTLVTDESKEFVAELTEQLNARFKELTKNNFRISTLDAAILCAVDYLGDKLKAEQRVRSLEAELSVAELTAAGLRAELDALKAELNGSAPDVLAADPLDTAVESASASAVSAEDKIAALENYLESKKNPAAATRSREEKIAYIESLLRGTADKGSDK